MKTKFRSFIYLGLPVGVALIFLLALFLALPGEAVLASPDAPNAVLLVDDFDYGSTPGDLTTVSGGAWTAHSGAGNGPIQYIATSLSMPGYGSSGVGGSATFGGGSEDVNTLFTAQSSGTVYAATLVNISSASGGTYFFHLKDSGFNYRARIFAQDNGGNLRFGFSNTSTATYSVTDFNYNTTYLIVAKFNTTTGDSALYVLDTYSSTEPSTPLLTSTGSTLTVSSFAIRQGSGGPTGTVDGVRVTTTWEDAVGSSAAFTISKSAPDQVSPGETFTYTLAVTNSLGISTTGTIITDVLPTGLTFVSASDSGVYASGVVSWTVPGTFTDGLTISRTFQASAPSTTGAEIVNETYAVHAAEWITLTYGAPITTTVSPLDLIVTKSGPQIGTVGGDLGYTITVDNSTGMVDAADVVVTDTLPISLTNIISASNALTITNLGDQIIWAFDTIISGTVETIYLTGTVDTSVAGGTVLTNTVEASTETAGDNPANNVDEVQTTVVPSPSCGDPATFIHIIQGSGISSPEVGNIHAIEGIVVGDFQTSDYLRGFFVQEDDANADADPMTSEGIFVYDGSSPAVDVNEGDVVRVVGTVDEYYGLTQLTSVSSVEVCPPGGTASAATPSLPATSVDDWEWIEGMLVNITQTLYTTEHYVLGRYGEISLSVNDRLFNPTQVITPGLDANTLQDLNDRSRIDINDSATVQNPDPIIYPSPELSATNTLRGGDTLPELTGVMNYSFGKYLIEPVEPITFTHSNPRTATPDSVGGSLQIASFNVLNYFSTIDTGADICGPNSDQGCRGADSASEFTRQRDKIINAILAMDVDIVGLMEIENHATDDAVDDLVNGLNAIAGAGTYAKVATDPIGTDAIKVALIYQPATATPVGTYAILDDSFDSNYHDEKNRPALAQTFSAANGVKVTVIVNHLKSKGSDCNDLGDPDTGDGQGNCNLTRTAAANVMLNWLATDPTSSGSPNFLIIGDLNSYAMEDPITALEAGGFTDLYRAFGGDDYSYVYGGQWGTLDYSLASAALLPDVTGATAWHINGDEPRVLDYNEEYKSTHQLTSLYASDAYRASDHDPIIVGLDLSFEVPNASFISNSPVTLDEVSVFTNTSTGDAPFTYKWDFGDSITSTLESPAHIYELIGTYTVTLTVTNVYGSDVYTDTHTVETLIWEIILPLIFKNSGN